MLIILSIPLGFLCFIIAYHCFKADHAVKALWCVAIGVIFLVGGAVMGYGTVVMMQNIEPKKFERAAPGSTYTATESDSQATASI